MQEMVIEAGHAERNYWHDIWRYRELFWFLAWRDILVRYKQTVLGVTWALLQPFLTMVVFTVVFGRVAKLPSHGVPYPILVFAALLPWQFFSRALSESSMSLITNTNLALCQEAQSSGAYVQGVQYALSKFHAITNVYNYIDAAHHGWLGWDSNFGPATITRTSSGLHVEYRDGTMECDDRQPKKLACDWTEGSANGKAELTIESSRVLRGHWGNGTSSSDGGSWLFVRR